MKIKGIISSFVLMLVAVVSQIFLYLSLLFGCIVYAKDFNQGLTYCTMIYERYFYLFLMLNWGIAILFYDFLGYHWCLKDLKIKKMVGTVISASLFLGIGLNIFVTSFLEVFGFGKTGFVQHKALRVMMDGENAILGFIAIALIGPFFEEIVFRKYIQEELLSGGFSGIIVVLIQGFLFGIYHFDLVQSSYAFVIGIILGFLVYDLGHLLPSILTHCFINGFSFLIARFHIEWAQQQSVLSLLLGLGFIFIGYYEFTLIKKNDVLKAHL